jgi:hypothetical protein
MTAELRVELMITLTDPSLTAEERDQDAKQLLTELLQTLNNLEADELVGPIPDPNPPEDNKGLVAFLVGVLKAKVTVGNGLKVLKKLGDIGHKPMEISGKVKGKKGEEKEFVIKVNSPKDLDAAVEAYQKLTQS